MIKLPELLPEPKDQTIVKIRDPLRLSIGEIVNPSENDIDINVDTKGASFIKFDQSLNEINIQPNVTT